MTLLPEPATIQGAVRGSQVAKRIGQTFSVDPKKRTCRLPFLKDVALEKPGCCCLVMSIACDIVVRRGIRWGEPFLNALPQLAP